MQLSNVFAVLVAGLSLVAADDDYTTTSTSTMTRTVTLTQCNPTYTNCPARNTSTAYYPVSNSTSSTYPTGYYNTTTLAYPTDTTTSAAKTTSAPKPTNTVASSGAGSLFAQTGFVLGLVGASVMVLA
jgi:hypothetical protein